MANVQIEAALLAQSNRCDWEQLSNKAVLITGATGLIGSCCARTLLERNRAMQSGIRVYALVRSLEKAHAMLDGYSEQDGLHFIQGDVEALSTSVTFDYIIHAACPTSSSFFASNPVETANSIVSGTVKMLELARICQAKLVYVSSMEVYGEGNAEAGIKNRLDEAQVGYVDPMSVRSCYPEGKRMAENYCAAFAEEYGVHAAVARLAQTFGPGIAKSDKRIFAMLARCALAGEPIVLKTTGASTRMYNHTFDAVAAIFTILLRGQAGRAYNVANEATYCSIYEMAQFVVENFSQGQSKVIIDLDPNAPYPPEHHLPLNTDALRDLGWRPQYDLRRMYADLIECVQ